MGLPIHKRVSDSPPCVATKATYISTFSLELRGDFVNNEPVCECVSASISIITYSVVSKCLVMQNTYSTTQSQLNKHLQVPGGD